MAADQDALKIEVGQAIAARVKNGETIGVGTGSTVDAALKAIAARVQKDKLNVRVVPTSLQSSWRCEEIGLTVMYSGYCGELAWGFDGADEVDDRLRLIKGKGGAMLQEKILAARCKEFIVIVDASKVVKKLGHSCAIPLEVIPTSLSIVQRELTKLGAGKFEVRQAVKKHGPVITEAGNIIVDVNFSEISDHLESQLKGIIGVVESGLFTRYASEVWIAGGEGNSGIRVVKR